MSISGALSYKLEINGSANTCADTSTCRPAFQTCVEVYTSRPNIFVEIYAWRQRRYFGIWGSKHRVNTLSARWDLVSSKRSKLWGECRSPVDSSMCAVPISSSSTEVGEIVPPRDYKSECLCKQCMLCSTNEVSSPWSHLSTSDNRKRQISLHYSRSGEFLLSSAPSTFTVCQECVQPPATRH